MKKQNIIMGISFVLLFVMVMGVSYAAYRFSAAGTKENVISTGTISMSYSQNSFIDLKNTYPKTDIYAIGTKEDKSSMEFSVSMETSGTTTINYVLALTEIEEGETLKSDKVKIYLEKEGKVVNNFKENKGQTIDSFKNKYVEGLIDNYAIYQDILTTSKETHNYTLTSWIDESYILPIKNETITTKETNKETYKFKVKVVGVDTPITIKEKASTIALTNGALTLSKLTNNSNSSGLYTITHAADSTLQIGTTEDITEYRYRGANPKNYVTFNNEVWRILGVFPTDDGTGNIEYRIKLIRNESVGDNYWNNCTDANNDRICDDTNKAMNDWTGATLNTYLNETYLNSINSTSKSLISNTKYYLGGLGAEETTEESIIKAYQTTGVQLYGFERKIQNGNCSAVKDGNNTYYVGTECYYYGTNPNSWTGKIGLMYSSDYFYASENCENKMMGDVTDESEEILPSRKDIMACNDTNWLNTLSVPEWLLTPLTFINKAVLALEMEGYVSLNIGAVDMNGYTYNGEKYYFSSRPVLYLTSNVQITGGSGTSSSPYTLGL